MPAIKIRVLSRQSRGPFRNMNPGEIAVHPMGSVDDFTALGVRNATDPAFRTLTRTGEANGIRVLEIDLDGKGLKPFKVSQKSEEDEAKVKAIEQRKAEAAEAERLKAEEERVEARRREVEAAERKLAAEQAKVEADRAKAEADRLKAEADAARKNAKDEA